MMKPYKAPWSKIQRFRLCARILVVGLLSLCAAGACAQGTLVLFNNIANSVVTHIYAPDPVALELETGNGANDYPPGSTVYNGAMIGGATGAEPAEADWNLGLINYTYGNNFTAQIYALANPSGGVLPFSSLLPVSQYVTTLATTAAQGPGFIVAVSPAGDPGIPDTGYDAINQVIDNRATVSLVAWYNAGGTINSLAAASAAHVPLGWSTPFNLAGLGEPGSVESAASGGPMPATFPRNMIGLTSFELVVPSIGPGLTPEPSTIALGVLGACAFLACRRKNR